MRWVERTGVTRNGNRSRGTRKEKTVGVAWVFDEKPNEKLKKR
jgi:hypothetical protein